MNDKEEDGQKAPSSCSALYAHPIRNCDRFAEELDARIAFISYYNEMYDLKGSKYEIDTCDLKHDVDGILHDYIEWLFAPAKPEMEGGEYVK